MGWPLLLGIFSGVSACGAPDISFAEPDGTLDAVAEQVGIEAEDRRVVEDASAADEVGDAAARQDSFADQDAIGLVADGAEVGALDRGLDATVREIDGESGSATDSSAESGVDVIERTDAPPGDDVIDDRRDASPPLADAADENGDANAWNTCPATPPPQTTVCQGNVPCIARNATACAGANAFCQTCSGTTAVCCVPNRSSPSCVQAPADCVP